MTPVVDNEPQRTDCCSLAPWHSMPPNLEIESPSASDQQIQFILSLMLLLDLPLEILSLIFEHVGLAELRTSPDYLLVSKPWYWALLPVYLSAFQLSTIYVLSNDLERFPRSHTVLGKAIQARLTCFSLCLDGLPSRDPTLPEDAQSFSDDDLQWLEGLMHCHRYGSEATLLHRIGVRLEDEEIREKEELERRLTSWRSRMNDNLDHFVEFLLGSHKLNDFSIETTLSPRWDYISASSMKRLMSSLPSTLKTFTLDTHASEFFSDKDDMQSLHLCPLIS